MRDVIASLACPSFIQSRAAALGLASLAALMFSACGGRPQPVEFKNQVVTGKILLAGGKPLTKGQRRAAPQAGAVASPSTASSKPDGTFTLERWRPGGRGIARRVPGQRRARRILPRLKESKPKGLPYPPKYLDSDNGLNVTISPDTKELAPITLK